MKKPYWKSLMEFLSKWSHNFLIIGFALPYGKSGQNAFKSMLLPAFYYQLELETGVDAIVGDFGSFFCLCVIIWTFPGSPQYEPKRLVVGHVIPHPVDKDEQSVFHANNGHQVYKHPSQPGNKSGEFQKW